MANTNNSELLNRLTEEIERGWNERRDHEIVYRLATQHPELAGELYDFFADVIEAEDGYDQPRPEREGMDTGILDWLRSEGFARAAAAAADAGATSVSSPTMPAKEPVDLPGAPSPAPGKTFVAYIRRATGKSVQALAKEMDIPPDFLVDVSDNAHVLSTGARTEIVRRAERVKNLDASIVLATLSRSAPASELKAASRNKPYAAARLTYADLVRRSSMDDAHRAYWLGLV